MNAFESEKLGRLNKLKSLVSRAGAYSKFLADKLESRQQEISEQAMQEDKENSVRKKRKRVDSFNDRIRKTKKMLPRK
jgi:hypothetical protein